MKIPRIINETVVREALGGKVFDPERCACDLLAIIAILLIEIRDKD